MVWNPKPNTDLKSYFVISDIDRKPTEEETQQGYYNGTFLAGDFVVPQLEYSLDYNQSDKVLVGEEEIELTEEEKSRLASAKEQYQQYIEKHGLVGSNILIEDCVYKETPLVAGKYNPLALESTTNYLNIARVGLGLTPLKLCILSCVLA